MSILSIQDRLQKLVRWTICSACIAASSPVLALNLSSSPLYVTASQPPLVMLTMARDHKLYYEAYNDYSDLDGDGVIDFGYKPSILYYGYFDSYKCYSYSSGVFTPVSMSDSTTDTDGNTIYNKKCTGSRDSYWSGDFLNYVTTSRMDALRKVFYGGYRSTDTSTQTILERAFIPQDAHSWGKEYTSVAVDGYDITEYTPLSLPASGKRHLFANVTLTGVTSAPLMRVLTDSSYRVWEWVSIERPVAGSQCATGNNVRTACTTGGATLTDYTVRVEVCKLISGLSSDVYYGRESNCKAYGSSYKPTGLLHTYGENNGMYFGLLTGSYDQNTNGGILRKAVSSITNEIELSTGSFKNTGSTCGTAGTSVCASGIVDTINRLRITSFNYSNQTYSCGWITTRQMNDGECEMWGNPLAEMMYEVVRYFSGASGPTSAFVTSTTKDDALNLPKVTSSWTNPYTESPASPLPDTGPFPRCSKPFMMLVSDVSPSFDSDFVPGADSNFGSVAATTINGASLNASNLGQTLWNYEFGGSATSKSVFAGQVGAVYDGAPTAKTATSFGNIRGLAPSDPTRQGSYYAASVAHFAKINDVNAITGSQNASTYAIALSAPLPTIQVKIPNTTNYVAVVPFAKSVAGSSISADSGSFQPTNQIVDFYVDTIKNTTDSNTDASVNGGRPYYKFRINFEDVEQGADHDMDAIAVYEISLNADNTVTVKVDSVYAAGGISQHMGYVISGTTADGIYLVVRDSDTDYASDPEYFLDRPKVTDIGADSSYHLPTSSSDDANVPNASNYATRTFTANAGGTSTTVLRDPLWYAAKYGGFTESNADNVPQTNEWDSDGDGVPDTYYMVVNPLKLLAQLNAALIKIQDSVGTSAALTTNSFSFQTDTLIYQARYNTDGWSGELIAYPVSATSISDPKWQAQLKLADKATDDRVILTYDPDKAAGSRGIAFRWNSMTSTGTTTTLRTALNKNSAGTADSLGSSRVDYLRGNEISGMRTRPRVTVTTITGSCSGTYTCPSGGGTAQCSDGGSVVCTPTSKVNRLGDIINSQAQYVGRPWFGYADSSYAKFSTDYNATSNPTGKGGRTEMVYVGANDGMLHGFNALTGEELIAYVPGEMYRQRGSKQILSKLVETDYGKATNPHRYYVDATPTWGDVCTSTNVDTCPDGNWRSILVGGLGAGGQGIYALDITDPANFSENNASSLVKWEYSDKDDADIGYTFGRPYVVRLCTNRDNSSSSSPKTCNAWSWYVLFNNGYNNTESDGYQSTTGDAALFVLNANTGALVKKIRVYEGDTATPNGLSEIAPVDIDGDGTVDYVYAGDLKGNLWRFDFTSDSTNSWAVAFGSSTNPNPLYAAWDEQSTRARQPITSAPDVTLHPQGGVIVTFGTGQYIDTGDPSTTQVQTMYGIWDKLDGNTVASTDRSNLQQQTVNTTTVTAGTTFSIGGEVTNKTYTYRTISTNSVDWTTKKGWYINLPDSKERIAFNPEIRGGNVLRFTTVVPSSDVCESGGYSWEYFINPLTGGQLEWSVFADLQARQNFGGTMGYAAAVKSTVGITPPSVIITEGKGRGTEFGCGSSGDCEGRKLNLSTTTAGRVSWRELLNE